MKGVVFVELVRMVEETFSLEMADQMIEGCDLASGGAYTAVGTYDHQEVIALVSKLSELTATPVPALVTSFGEYLFKRFFARHPGFFDNVDDALDFLAMIEDVIHVDVRKLYPQAQLPRFDIERISPDKLIMVYRSERHLGDLAEGLIRQCIRHFGTPIDLVRENLEAPDKPIRFTLTRHNA